MMKKAIDNFSEQAGLYQKFRPSYPDMLYQEILRHTPGRDLCWDCGTGNGQVAVVLSKYFRQVYASDLSADQLRFAAQKDNISYLVQRAEKTNFENNQFDLITVAQAMHWFDVDKFNREMKRVAKDGATLAVWGYGLLRINKPINDLIDHFYTQIVGPYWDKERTHVDEHYQNIHLDMKEINTDKDFVIEVEWTLETFIGYLNTWSSVRKYIRAQEKNPVEWMYHETKETWEKDKVYKVRFPVFL